MGSERGALRAHQCLLVDGMFSPTASLTCPSRTSVDRLTSLGSGLATPGRHRPPNCQHEVVFTAFVPSLIWQPGLVRPGTDASDDS
jgi:hypothetical protein